ncbi:MAG: O-antigen ligase family protein [Candidatus Korobacteraceae bacterium]
MFYKARIAAGPRSPNRLISANAWIGQLAGSPTLSLTLAGGLTLAIAAMIFLPKLYVAAAAVGLMVAAGMMYLVARTMHARVDGALLTWLLISPLAYYFLSVPSEKPIFTLDRFIIAVLTGAVIFVPNCEATPVPRELKRAAWAWILFLMFAFSSLVPVWSDLGVAGSRLITEAFIFPALLALFIIRVFPAQLYVRQMHTLIAGMTVYCAAIAILELITDQDLLPIPGATFYGTDQTGALPRVNGPFDTNFCLALIGAISLFLLFFLRSVMDGPISRGRKWIHWTGIVSATVMILLPQFRTLAIAFAIVLFLELYRNRRVSARLAGTAIVLLLMLAILWLPAVAPTFFDTRIADPANFYARVAQQQQTWELFLHHPLNGVGFANFMQAIQTVSSTSFHEVASVDTAHNSLGSIMAETGIAGTLPFLTANVFWFLAFFRLRHVGTPVAAAAWRYFLYIFLCYWIMGVTLVSAYERDLNLWYMLACAILYKLALVEQHHYQSEAPQLYQTRIARPALENS